MRPTFGIVTRHIAALQLRYSLVLASGLAACIWLFSIIDRLRRLDTLTLWQQLLQAVLPIPSALLNMLPLILGGATFIVVGILQRSGALVTLAGSGRSPLRTVNTFALNAFLMTALAIAAMSPLAAAGMRGMIVSTTVAKGDDLPQRLRYATPDGYLMVLPQYQDKPTAWRNVYVLHFNNQNIVQQRFDAQSALWQDNTLFLYNVRSQSLTKGMDAERQKMLALSTLPPQHDPAQQSTNAVSIWALPQFIHKATDSGFSARDAQLALHSQLASPLVAALAAAVAVLVVPKQRRGTSWLKAVLLLAFFLFWGYVCITLAAALASVGLLPIATAIWGVRIILTACLIMIALRYNERL